MMCLFWVGVVSCLYSVNFGTPLVDAMIRADFGVIRVNGVKECVRPAYLTLKYSTICLLAALFLPFACSYFAGE